MTGTIIDDLQLDIPVGAEYFEQILLGDREFRESVFRHDGGRGSSTTTAWRRLPARPGSRRLLCRSTPTEESKVGKSNEFLAFTSTKGMNQKNFSPRNQSSNQARTCKSMWLHRQAAAQQSGHLSAAGQPRRAVAATSAESESGVLERVASLRHEALLQRGPCAASPRNGGILQLPLWRLSSSAHCCGPAHCCGWWGRRRAAAGTRSCAASGRLAANARSAVHAAALYTVPHAHGCRCHNCFPLPRLSTPPATGRDPSAMPSSFTPSAASSRPIASSSCEAK